MRDENGSYKDMNAQNEIMHNNNWKTVNIIIAHVDGGNCFAEM